MLHWLILIAGTSLLVLKAGNLRNFLFVVIMTMPLNGVFIEVGQRIELFKVASLLILPLGISRLQQLLGVRELRLFVPFILWVLWISILNVCYPPDYIFDPGLGFRSIALRSAVQVLLLFSRVVLIGLFLISFTQSKDVWRGLQSLILATTTLAIFGLLEQLFHLAGVEIGGVFYKGINGEPTHLTFSAFGIEFKRIGSLAHEPKMLARWLIPSTIILLFDSLRMGLLSGGKRRSRNLAILHALAILFTFSTSGYIILMTSLFVPLFSSIRDHGRKLKYGFSVFLMCIFVLFYLSQSGLIDEVVGKKFEQYGGFLQGGSDGPGWNFLQQNPMSIIWGSGWSMQGFYLPAYIQKSFNFVYENYSDIGFGGFGVESGWLSLILDIGIIGLCFFMIPIYSSWNSSSLLLKSAQRTASNKVDIESIVLLRCLLGCYLIGMIAYPLEMVGGVAITLGLLICAIKNTTHAISNTSTASELVYHS